MVGSDRQPLVLLKANIGIDCHEKVTMFRPDRPIPTMGWPARLSIAELSNLDQMMFVRPWQ